MNREEILRARDKSIAHLKHTYGDEPEFVIADARYGFISGLLKETLKHPPIDKPSITDRIDKVLLNRLLGIPIFLICLLAIFQISFILSGPLVHLINSWFDNLGERALSISPEWLGSLLGNGATAGVGAVLSFLPPIFLLFMCLTLLEDCGYMTRAAFVLDRIMHKVGLHGGSFIPMIIGFGCSVPGVLATRSIENRKDRITTILITPLMSCGARLPVYTLLAAAFFPKFQALVVFSFYIIGAVLVLTVALVLRKTLLSGPSGHFVMELPPYRLPTLKGIVIHTWERGKEFLMRAGTIIFAAVIFIWFMASMPWGVEYGSANSWIGQIGSGVAHVFTPCGFGQWEAAVALFFGLMSKEAVVGAFGTLLGVEQGSLGDMMAVQLGWTPLISYAFMIFVLLYMPCIATLAMMRRETKSWRWPALAMAYTTALAWIAAMLVYQIGTLFGW